MKDDILKLIMHQYNVNLEQALHILEDKIRKIIDKENCSKEEAYKVLFNENKEALDILYKPVKTSKNNYLKKDIIVYLCCIVVIAIIFSKALSGDNSVVNNSDDYYYACTVAQKEVKENLKSPSSAKFNSCSEMNITENEGIWTVKGKVEASNSFGAIIKNNFIVEIRRVGENTYNLISINIYE